MGQRRRKSTTLCGSSEQRRSTIVRARLIVSRVLSSLMVSIMSSTPSAAPTSALCIRATRRGGTIVGYGFLGATGKLATLAMFVNLFVGARLRGRRGAFYGITMLYRKDPKPLREDLPKIFALVAEKKIDPLVTRTFPLLDAKRAIELLATGSVEGKIVLTNA